MLFSAEAARSDGQDWDDESRLDRHLSIPSFLPAFPLTAHGCQLSSSLLLSPCTSHFSSCFSFLVVICLFAPPFFILLPPPVLTPQHGTKVNSNSYWVETIFVQLVPSSASPLTPPLSGFRGCGIAA